MSKIYLKTVVLFLLFSFSACNLSQKSTQDTGIIPRPNEGGTARQISENSLKANLGYLASNELRGRETGTEGMEKAARYIENSFKQSGVETYFETYRDSFEVKGRIGYNIVGFLEGTDENLKDEFIILGAHYDHIGLGKVVDGDSIANGANDNAAGTVAVMELAKYFAGKKLNKRSLLFMLFSAEEMGLIGAKHAASKLKAQKLDLYAMVNLEMIGVPMQGKSYSAYITGYENSNLAEKFNQYSAAEVLGFLPEAKQYNLFQRSDNYPFYQEFEVPAQTISTFDFTNYEFYHHVFDESERMNFAHMAALIEKIIPGLTKMASTSEKEIKLN